MLHFVSKGGSVLGYNGVQFKEGMQIEPGKDFPAKNAADLVKSGHLYTVGADQPKTMPPATRPAGVPEVPTLKRETEDKDSAPAIESKKNDEADKAAQEGLQEVRAANRVATKPALAQTKIEHVKTTERKAPTTPWTFDPIGLKGKSLDELNVMVAERQKDGPKFESVVEAVAFLTQDFQGK